MEIVVRFFIEFIIILVVAFILLLKLRKHIREKRWKEQWELEQKWKEEKENNKN